MSVKLIECANSPSAQDPECDTRSISPHPGSSTSHRSVRTGIWCLSSVPGFVRPYNRRRDATRTKRKRRSIVRGLIFASSALVSSVTSIRVATHGNQSGIIALSRTDHGKSAASQIVSSTLIVAAPYVHARR